MTRRRRAAGLLLSGLLLTGGLASCGGDGVGGPGGGLAEDGGDSGDGGDDGSGTGGGGTGETGESFSGGEQLPDQESGVILGAAFAGGTSHDFEVVPVGGSRRVSIQVRTTFDLLPFEVTGVSVSGSSFALADGSACQGVVLTEEVPSCQVLVSFTPESPGPHEGLFSTTGFSGAAGASTPAPTPTDAASATPNGTQQRTATLQLVGVGG